MNGCELFIYLSSRTSFSLECKFQTNVCKRLRSHSSITQVHFGPVSIYLSLIHTGVHVCVCVKLQHRIYGMLRQMQRMGIEPILQ